MSQRSMLAIDTIKNLCEKHWKDRFELEIIDIYKHPEAARDHQVIFSPSLIKTFPLPQRIIIGTFSDTDKVLKALGIGIV